MAGTFSLSEPTIDPPRESNTLVRATVGGAPPTPNPPPLARDRQRAERPRRRHRRHQKRNPHPRGAGGQKQQPDGMSHRGQGDPSQPPANPRGGRLGPVLVCDPRQTPPPPRVLRDSGLGGMAPTAPNFFVHASLSSNHPCFERRLARRDGSPRGGGGPSSLGGRGYNWAPQTRKRHQQEHRPQRPTERSDPTQHAKGRTGDCPGPRKGTTTRRTVTQGVGGGGALHTAPFIGLQCSESMLGSLRALPLPACVLWEQSHLILTAP